MCRQEFLFKINKCACTTIWYTRAHKTGFSDKTQDWHFFYLHENYFICMKIRCSQIPIHISHGLKSEREKLTHDQNCFWPPSQKPSSEGQKSMNEWIFEKKLLIKVAQWPQRPLSESSQIWATSSGRRGSILKGHCISSIRAQCYFVVVAGTNNWKDISNCKVLIYISYR